jgi:hypothetical protein
MAAKEKINGNNGAVAKHEGETVFMGGTEWVVPSLSMKQARKLWPKILELNQGITTQNIVDKYDIAVEVIHAALSRNYPALKIADVDELVDLRNVRKLILAVAGQSGLLSKGSEPAAISGTTSKLTGEISTASSSREPAGRSNT